MRSLKFLIASFSKVYARNNNKPNPCALIAKLHTDSIFFSSLMFLFVFFLFSSLWSQNSGSKLISELGMPKDILTGEVYPEEYLQLFQLMDKSQEFTQSWLYEEILENTEREGWG